MAGQENLRGQQPDAQPQEPQLPLAEAGRYAYDYIQRFKNALKGTPQFIEAFQEKYPTLDKKNPFAQAFELDFPKNDYRYSLSYEPCTSNSESEELDMLKDPLKRSESDEGHGAVMLKSWYWKMPAGIRFNSGLITHLSYNIQSGTHFSNNKRSTIPGVEGFLTSSFEEPQPPSTK